MKTVNRFVAAACAVLVAGAAFADEISKDAVIAAQKVWGEGIVAIVSAHKDGGDYEALAKQHIEDVYAYDNTEVMFKPTLAAVTPFRSDFDGALSYFICTDGSEDKGFAIKGWINVRWENNGVYTSDDTAMAMGHYFFTGPDGKETKVEYSSGYIFDDEGELKINLHHFSLPYAAE